MKTVLLAIACAMAITVTVVCDIVYSHCHNTHSHENVQEELVDDSQGTWDEPYNNTVEFYVNPSYPNMPNILEDAKEAAKKWSFIQFDGRTIPFKAKFRLTTDAYAGGSKQGNVWNKDNKNVVSWK